MRRRKKGMRRTGGGRRGVAIGIQFITVE